jgi:hypothetical protein
LVYLVLLIYQFGAFLFFDYTIFLLFEIGSLSLSLDKKNVFVPHKMKKGAEAP